MSAPAPKVLMITPFHSQQRGNSLTTARLKKGLESYGFNINLLSLEDNQAFAQFMTAFKTNQYDLVHAFHARHLTWVLEQVPAMQKLPLILTTTGTDIHFDIYGQERFRMEIALQATDKIVVFHQDFLSRIGQAYPELQSRLVVIPQGIDLPENPLISRQELDLNEDDFVFLLPSGLRPVKNITLTIDALEKVQCEYPYLKLLIMGADLNPDYSRVIRERIQNLSWVRYLGEIPHEKTRSFMELADAVINSSRAEGQPQAALEAMSLAKPCILTAVPGNLNIIEHGKEGFYVQNEADLSQAARVLVSNPELSKKMGRAAEQLVKRNFSLKREMAAYAALYRQLLQQKQHLGRIILDK